MRRASTNLLMPGVVLSLFAASAPVEAGENDDVLKVVDDFCVNPRDQLKDVGRKASKLGFGAEYGTKKGPPPVHAAWLPKLGTGSMLTFSAKNASEPVEECQLVSHVNELADLVTRLRARFDLEEPKQRELDSQFTTKGRKTIGGKVYSVELVYGFEENKPSGGFTLKTYR
jgi:hypothetical protein